MRGLIFIRFRRYLVRAVLLLLISPTTAQSNKEIVVLPIRYNEDRFYVEPITSEGVKLCFYTDTGGGLFIFKDVVDRLKLPYLKNLENGEENRVKLPSFKPKNWIPSPLGSSESIFVFSERNEDWLLKDCSGILGQQWFSGRIWTFDYPNRRLLLHTKSPNLKKENRVKLGFKTDPKRVRVTDFPRLQAVIDGETLDLLFDTGATTKISEKALLEINDLNGSIRATSFITATIFDKWRERHPKWRVIENAEEKTNASMIEVPEMTIAGYKVKSVWFMRRPDKNFNEFMSQWMDKKVEGAIGGNVFRHFRIMVDYPKAIAVFEKKSAR